MSFNVTCKQHDRTALNPFQSSKRNGDFDGKYKQALKVEMLTRLSEELSGHGRITCSVLVVSLDSEHVILLWFVILELVRRAAPFRHALDPLPPRWAPANIETFRNV